MKNIGTGLLIFNVFVEWKWKNKRMKKKKETQLTDLNNKTERICPTKLESGVVIWAYPRGDGPCRGCRSGRKTLLQLLCCAGGIRWLWPCTQERLQHQHKQTMNACPAFKHTSTLSLKRGLQPSLAVLSISNNEMRHRFLLVGRS